MKYLFRTIIISSISLFVLLQFWHLFISLPVFQLKQIIIEGNSILSEQRIKQTVKLPDRESLFLIDLTKPQKDLSNIVQVRRVSLKKKFPGTVIIKIMERKPWAYVQIKDNFWMIDDEGVALNDMSIKTIKEQDLPLLVGLASIKDIPMTVSEIKSLLTPLKESLPQIKMKLDLTDLFAIKLSLTDKSRQLFIKIGPCQEQARKVVVIKALLKVIENKWSSVEYIDVRVPKNAVIKYR
jgi:cell division protein FtsQ